MFMSAAFAAALGMFGAGAQATQYGVVFDPPTILGHFTGGALLDVTGDCGSSEPITCQIDLLSAFIDASSTFGPGWTSQGQTNIATDVLFDGHLIAFDSVLIDLFNPEPGSIPCMPSLRFTSTFDPDFLGHQGFIADLECLNADQENVGDNAVYILAQVPEPGTLALILGGVGAAWLTRRRKAAS